MGLSRRMMLAAALILLAAGQGLRAEIIDRVLAVVAGEVVTLSDVRAALRFGLVSPGTTTEDPVAAALQRLIDRRLILNEIERYAPPEPADAAIEAGFAAVRARFEDALAFDTAIGQTAMSHEELRHYVRDTLRIETYLQQRFGSIAQASEDELLAYYKGNPAAFTVDGVLLPFSAVREQVVGRVDEQRRSALIAEWLDGLRRRSNVVVLYLPGRA